MGYVVELGLAYRKQVDVAVPAILRCGWREGANAAPPEPQWARLTFAFAGILEIQPYALEEHVRTIASSKRAGATSSPCAPASADRNAQSSPCAVLAPARAHATSCGLQRSNR